MNDQDQAIIPAHHPNCFGCGPQNPRNLGLSMEMVGERVSGHIRFDDFHEGGPGLAHGGAVAAAFDDLLGSIPVARQIPAVTGRLTVDYRSPVFLGVDASLDAWLDRREGRKLFLRGTMRQGETVVAEAEALFVVVDLAHFRRAGRDVPESWKGWGSPVPPVAP